ncbi:hypothetical protein FOA52_013965 [Chlamydomonas sp. UWO 241]|nr:hypothetical protein FOA52_013965 [Chlamydomonas sp. UWO 241]
MAVVTSTPTPELVSDAAAQLGIDLASASSHLSVALAFVESELPAGWTRALDADGKMTYVEGSSPGVPEHPQLEQFKKLLASVSDAADGADKGRTKMKFVRADGSVYYHSFAPDSSADAATAPDQDGSAAASIGRDEAGGPGGAAPAQAGETPQADESELIQPVSTAQLAAFGIIAQGAAAATSAPPEAAEVAASEDAAALDDAAAAPAASAPGDADVAPTAAEAATGDAAAENAAVAPVAAEAAPFGLASLPATVGRGSRRLRFYSWWYEDAECSDLTGRVDTQSCGGGLARRYVTLDYDLSDHSFTMRSASADQELVVPGVLPVVTSSGAVACAWDLHVGATLRVLGRNMSLLKAEGDTAAWLERHAKTLTTLKAELLSELQKYKPQARPTALVARRGGRVHQGGLDLRHTADQVSGLLQELEAYRPSLAAKYRARISVPVQ